MPGSVRLVAHRPDGDPSTEHFGTDAKDLPHLVEIECETLAAAAAGQVHRQPRFGHSLEMQAQCRFVDLAVLVERRDADDDLALGPKFCSDLVAPRNKRSLNNVCRRSFIRLFGRLAYGTPWSPCQSRTSADRTTA